MTAYATFDTQARTIDILLAQYGEHHRNPANERIQRVCVPVILFSLLGLLWSLHPLVALAASAAALTYYVKLSRPFALGMLALIACMLVILAIVPTFAILPLSIALFVVAWIGQFIGHKIEGRKAAFFDDLRFLLVGPLFVLSFLYRRLRVAY